MEQNENMDPQTCSTDCQIKVPMSKREKSKDSSFFSAKPKLLMNVEAIQEVTERSVCPTPLSFARNGNVSQACQKSI